MDKLKPCPFCGGPCTEQGMDFDESAIQYGCSNRCEVHPVVTSWSGNMDQIIAAWNTRTPQADKEEK